MNPAMNPVVNPQGHPRMRFPMNPTSPAVPGARGVSRRSLLQNLSFGLGAAALLPSAVRHAMAAPSNPNFLVIINMFGGNDSLNTYVPYGLGAYYDQRPSVAIPQANVLPIVAGEGLHPQLAAIHPLWGAGDLAVVRQVGYPDPNLSHFESMDIWSRGLRAIGTTTDPRGWIGRAADLHFPGTLDVVGVGVGRRVDFVADVAKPLVVEGLESYGPGTSAVPWWELSQRDAAAKAMLAAAAPAETAPAKDLRASLSSAYALVDVIHQADAGYTSAVTYPDAYFATRLRDVAKLVQANLGGRVYYTGLGGFDTHADQAGQHANLMQDVGGAIAAFRQDLVAMGAWDRAVILVISEFGRRVYDNASAGTDHGHGQTVLAMGGAIQGGAYGPAFSAADLTQNEDVPGVVDFRAIYKNVLRKHLGIDPTPIFPEAFPGMQEVPLFGA